MSGAEKAEKPKTGGLKKRVVRESIEYLFNFVYLAVFLSFFAWYRRLILAEYEIAYLNYGIAIVEALVLAKVVLAGDALGLGRGLFAGKPLIVPTLYRAVVFGIFVAAFRLIERTIGGLLHGKGLAGGFREMFAGDGYVVLANSLVVFFAFVPFFAFKELGRVLGERRIIGLFFRKGE